MSVRTFQVICVRDEIPGGEVRVDIIEHQTGTLIATATHVRTGNVTLDRLNTRHLAKDVCALLEASVRIFLCEQVAS